MSAFGVPLHSSLARPRPSSEDQVEGYPLHVLRPGPANELLGRTIRFVALAALAFAAGATPQGQGLADLMAAAKIAGEVLAFDSDYVRIRYAVLEYPAAECAVAESRPVVLFIRAGRNLVLATRNCSTCPEGLGLPGSPALFPEASSSRS